MNERRFGKEYPGLPSEVPSLEGQQEAIQEKRTGEEERYREEIEQSRREVTEAEREKKEYDLEKLDEELDILVFEGVLSKEEKKFIIEIVRQNKTSRLVEKFGERIVKIVRTLKKSEKK